MTSITHELPTHHKRRRNVLKKERELLVGHKSIQRPEYLMSSREGGLLGQASTSVAGRKKKKECRRHTEQLTADHYHLNDRQYGPIVKWPPPSSSSSGHLCNTQRKVNGSCTIVPVPPPNDDTVCLVIISIRSDFQLSVVGGWGIMP